MLYIQKKAPSSSTICKKNQIDIINFTPTGCYQKRSIKKKHPLAFKDYNLLTQTNLLFLDLHIV